MSQKGRYDRHVFVCINDRPSGHPRGSCAARGALEVQERLRKLTKQASDGSEVRIRINRSLCLDVCERGPAMVVYPENCWYGNLKDEDLEEVVERHLIGGEAVERLRIPDSELRG